MDRKVNIFVIYAWEDNEIKDHLLRHLNSMDPDFNVSIWHDVHINAWKNWQPYFESHLKQTDLFLLLLSVDFMKSQFFDQPEIINVLDRYKEGKSAVIPLIIDHCKWDINLITKDEEFNLSELKALPEEGKPIGDWNSPDQAYNNVMGGVRRVISSIADNHDQDEANRNMEKEEADSIGEYKEDKSIREEIDAEEENRLWEEAEAKRRAEVKKKILEAAEASARRRAEEENRLMEEAVAKRKAEEESRLREVADGKRRAEEENRLMEEAAAKRRAATEKKLIEEVAAKRKAEEEKRGKQKEIKSKAEAANRLKADTEFIRKEEEVHQEKRRKLKKTLLVGSIIAVLVVVGIWAFSVFNADPEIQTPSLQNMNRADEEDSPELEETKSDTLDGVVSLSKLDVGDTYEGGIVFAIDQDYRTGKIVHPEDAGPMTWTNAMKIDEQLGEGWRLPTLNELEIMYRTIGQGATNIGEFTSELYWSATSYDDHQARLLRFWDGNSSYHYNKELEHRKFRVRAIRDFKR